MGRVVVVGITLVLLLGAAALHPGLRRTARSVLEHVGLIQPYHEGPLYRSTLARYYDENGSLPEGCVVLLGDNLTEAFPDDLARPRARFARGISGDRVRHVRARLAVSALESRCPVVALLVGSNDLVNDGAHPGEVAAQILAIVEEVRSAGKRVILTTVPPTRGTHEAANPAIQELNALLQRRAGDRVRVADLHTAVLDEDGLLAERYSRDGLHFREGAYLLWRDRLEAALAYGAGAGGG